MAKSPQRQGIETREAQDGRERHRAYVRERGTGKLRRGPWRSSPSEARADRVRMLSANEAGTLAARTGRAPTLRAAAERWLDAIEAGEAWTRKGRRYAPRTVAIYRQDFRLYILPALGDRPVDVIRRSDVQALVDEVAVLRSGQRANMMLGALGALYRHLGRRDDDLVDPTARLDRPEGSTPRERVLMPDELRAHVLAGPQPWHRAFLALCGMAGLRAGEARALTVSGVRLDARTLVVPRWKHARRPRALPIFDPLVPVLEEQLATLDARPDALVLPRLGRRGRAIGANEPADTDTWMTKYIRPAWTGAGLDAAVIPHELRHSFASHLVAAGYDVATVAEWIGHERASTTLDVYVKGMRARGLSPAAANAYLGELPAAFVSHGVSHGR